MRTVRRKADTLHCKIVTLNIVQWTVLLLLWLLIKRSELTRSSKHGLDVLRKSQALIRPSTPPVAIMFRSYFDQSHANTSVLCAASFTTGEAG